MDPDHVTSPADNSFEMESYGRDRKALSNPTRSPPLGEPLHNFSDRRTSDDGALDDGQDPERVLLLRSSGASSSSDAGEGEDARRTLPGTPSVLAITVAASILILILDIVGAVPTAPRMVIFEDIICRNHYASSRDGADHVIDCKIEPVQSELARINGWKETFDTIPGLIVSVPYGALANRIGRGKVLMLALVGCLLSETWVATVCYVPRILPLRMVWLSGMFQLVGGGGATVVSMCYTMIGDACSVEQRTAAFSQVHGAVLLSELISIPLGAALIAVNPWIPVLSALGFSAAATLISFFFTLKYSKYIDVKPKGTNLSVSSNDDDSPSLAYPPAKTTWSRWRQHVTDLAADISPWLNRNVLLMLVAFFFCQLSRQFSSVLIQYCSYKFNWGYAKSSYLLPLRAGVNLVVLFTILPRLTTVFVTKRGFRGPQSDKYITMMSGCCLVIGSLLIFLSAHSFILILGQTFVALGFAFTVTARSFLTAMVDPRYMSLLYTSVTTVTYGGLIIGGPLLAAAFQWGLQLGSFWVGMPFLVTAILFSLATLAVAAARSRY